MKHKPRQYAILLVGLACAAAALCAARESSAQSSAQPAAPSYSEDVRSSSAARVAERVRERKLRAAQQPSYGFDRAPAKQTGFLPRHLRNFGSPVYQMDEPEMMSSETIVQEQMPGDVEFEVAGEPIPDGAIHGPDCAGPGCGGCGDCGGCGSCDVCVVPCPRLSLDDFEFWAGAHGATGPANRGETGSFGFQYGVNWAAPGPCGGLGLQAGFQGVHSNFSGAEFTDEARSQQFVTLGLFRRVDWGLQGGIVADYLHDEWYYDVNVAQLRGELSWVFQCDHEFGFWTASALSEDTAESTLFDGITAPTTETTTWESTDIYAFFYRRRFKDCNGGEGRIYGGWSNDSAGVLGADIRLPINDSIAFQGEFTYLIPENSNTVFAHEDEAWNVSINLVWYPGCRGSRTHDYFRPLFNVADNGSFILRAQ